MEFAASVLGSMAVAVGGAPGTALAGAAAGASTLAEGGALTEALGYVGEGISAGIGQAAPTGFGGASIVSNILSGSASLLQMSQLRSAGRQQALTMNLQAQDTRTDIAQENIQGTARALGLRRALLDTIGERDAAYAASGIDIGFGTPALAREEAVSSAESALSQDAAATTARVSRLNERAQNLRLMARQARRSGGELADLAGLSAAGNLIVGRQRSARD